MEFGAAGEDLPEGEPGESDEAGEPECAAPAKGLEDGGHDERGDDGAEGTAGIGNGDAAGALDGREGLDDGAEAAGEGGAFAEAEGGAGEEEGEEAGGEGVGGRAEAPEGDGGGHGDGEAEAVNPPAPEEVSEHVGNGEAGDDPAVLFAGELEFGEHGGGKEGKGIAVDVADERDQHHRDGGDPLAEE